MVAKEDNRDTDAQADEESGDGPLIEASEKEIKKMVTRAKERGIITYDEINRVLPPDQVSSEQIEDVMTMLSEMGISVVESDENEEGDEAESETEASALPGLKARSASEEVDRTDDPVRMYLREMGSVELLSREG